MSKLSRRQLITTGLAATGGASGLAVAATLARRYGLIPPDGGGIYGPGETLTYAAQRILDSPLPGARVRPQPDLEASVRKRGRSAGRALQAPPGSRFRRLASQRGWHGRPARIFLARSELKGFPWAQPDHSSGLRRGLVVYSRMDRRASVSHPESGGSSPPSPLRYLPFDSSPTGGKASTWPMHCTRKLWLPTG